MARKSIDPLLALVVFLGAFLCVSCASGRVDPEAEKHFWQWFQQNDQRLARSESNVELVTEINDHLKQVNPDLTCTIGPKTEGQREFIISADGLREVFPAVISLADHAPKSERWQIIKFRQASSPQVLNFEGLSLEPKDCYFDCEPENDMVKLTLYVKGYDAEPKMAALALLMLDHLLGEYDVETKIGTIDPKDLSARLPASKNISHVREAVDEVLSKNKSKK